MTFNQVYQYNFPTTIRFGAGASKELEIISLRIIYKSFDRYRPYSIATGFFRVIINDLKEKYFYRNFFSHKTGKVGCI